MSVSHGPGLVIGSSASWVGQGMIGAPDTGVPFTLSPSTHITAGGENTTARLTAPSGKSGNFTAGRLQDDKNPADATNIADSYYSEFEWNFIATPDSVYGGVYEWQVFVEDTPFNTYTEVPELTITSSSVGQPRLPRQQGIPGMKYTGRSTGW